MPRDLGQPSKLEARTSQPSGAMDKKLGGEAPAATFEEQLAIIDKQRAAIESRVPEKKGLGEALLQPEALIKMAAAIAGGVSGDQTLQGLGMALGSGTLQGVQGQVDEFNAGRQKQIDDLTSMVDKQQQRLVTLLQTQPGMFVGQDGEDISSQEEWLNILPIGMPFDISALLRRRSVSGKNPMTVAGAKMMDIGIRTKNPVALKEGMHLYSGGEGLDWSDEYIESMALTNPDNFLDKLLEEHTGISVTKLVNTANRQGKSVLDPSLQGILVRDPKIPVAKTVEEQDVVNAKEALQEWLKNDDHLALWEKNPYDALEQAFEGDPVALAALQDSSQFFNRGPRSDELRLRTEAEMWKEANALAIVTSGGLTATGKKKRDLMTRMSGELDAVFEHGRDVVTIDKNKRTAQSAGAMYAKQRNLPPEQADTIGSQLVVRRNALIRAAGLEPNQTPNEITDAFMMASRAYMDWLFGTGSEEEYQKALAAANAKAGG